MDNLEEESGDHFKWSVLQGDCLEVLRECPDDYFDSVCTDPPAGVSFMNHVWDSDKGGRDQWITWLTEIMKEVWRATKPGGHAFVWAMPRTSHWTAMAMENSGWECRHQIVHLYGSGFPKSQNVGAMIDKLAGADREVIGPDRRRLIGGRGGVSTSHGRGGIKYGADVETVPATDDAKAWDGWGSAVKPGHEIWWLFRKPLSESSIARNVLTHRTGALNIAACRVERAAEDVPGWHESGAKGSGGYQGEDTFKIRDMSPEEVQIRCGDKGRWPPDVLLTCTCGDLHDDPSCPIVELDRQSGTTKSGHNRFIRKKSIHDTKSGWGMRHEEDAGQGYGDSGGASRFFPTFRYQAKPSRSEREAGCENLPTAVLNRVNPGGLENEPRFAPVKVKNNHPTVKSMALMTWLITLITPPNGMVLDPFCGSGSTGAAAVSHGFRFVGIDESEEYCQIARARIRYWEVKIQCEK